MKQKAYFFVIILVVAVLLTSCQKPTRNLYPKTLVGGLKLLDSGRTGVDFSNTMQESKFLNHYFYSQIYVGSGVAIGDINNDGLSDIFFRGNQVSDRLYLNKGNYEVRALLKLRALLILGPYPYS